jgi:hypothetical protein
MLVVAAQGQGKRNQPWTYQKQCAGDTEVTNHEQHDSASHEPHPTLASAGIVDQNWPS